MADPKVTDPLKPQPEVNPPSETKPDPEMGAPFPPPGEENKDPEAAANEAKDSTKSDAQKQDEKLADARNAVGGQAAGVQGHPTPPTETITSDVLKSSKQPLAPEHPLEVPDAQKK